LFLLKRESRSGLDLPILYVRHDASSYQAANPTDQFKHDSKPLLVRLPTLAVKIAVNLDYSFPQRGTPERAASRNPLDPDCAPTGTLFQFSNEFLNGICGAKLPRRLQTQNCQKTAYNEKQRSLSGKAMELGIDNRIEDGGSPVSHLRNGPS